MGKFPLELQVNDELRPTHDEGMSEDEFDVDSLFDEVSPIHESFPASPLCTPAPAPALSIPIAQCTPPPIPGMFFDPSVLISPALSLNLSENAQKYFHTGSGPGSVNQAMLFGRASEAGSGLPPFLDKLVIELSALLKPHLPAQAHALLFPSSAYASRQAILNHYTPGEGISPHVDLLTRFADGIVAVSLGSGTVMTFRRVPQDGGPGGEDRWDVYLPERSVLVLTGDARYKWSHGIEGRLGDWVEDAQGKSWVERGTRVSITLRWLLPGADIVG